MAWYDRAQVGDRVVCVQADLLCFGAPVIAEFDKTTILTIAEIMVDLDFRSGVGISIEGYDNQYCARIFRPVKKKTTDTGMEILKSILQGSPVTEDA